MLDLVLRLTLLIVSSLVASASLGACRQLAAYESATHDGGLPDAPRDGQVEVRDGADEAPLEAALPDAPSASVLLVDDDWTVESKGEEVLPGAIIGQNAFATISEALLVAEQNPAISEIVVRAGTYNDKVVIKQDGLTLRGAGRPILRQISVNGPADETVVTIAASNVTVAGFEIDAGGNGIGVVCPETDITIRDNHIHGMVNVTINKGVGILVWGACSKVVIRGNEVYENDRQGIYLGSTDSNVHATDCKIRENTVRDNGLNRTVINPPGPDPYGIQVHHAQRTEVRGNRVSGQDQTLVYNVTPVTGAGIWIVSDDTVVAENDVSTCVDGIKIDFAENTTVTGNTLHANTRGLLFTFNWSGSAVATDNIFCGNTTVALRNNGLTSVDARRCWWEDPAGANKTGQKAFGLIDTTSPLTTKPTKGPCSAP